MIITSGTLKFKRVSLSKKSRLRPTSNKVRQALFNILKHKLDMQRWQKNFTMLDELLFTVCCTYRISVLSQSYIFCQKRKSTCQHIRLQRKDQFNFIL